MKVNGHLIESGADLQDATLWGVDLQDATLQDADLQDADLRGANLRGANLRGANLRGANLRRADLRGVNLWGADLQGATLWGVDLQDADLRGANLRGADLQGANLRGANLQDAYYDYQTIGIHAAPQGTLTVYKQCRGAIIRLQIPARAKRSCATTRKHRAEYAKVLAITTREGKKLKRLEHQSHGHTVIYEVGTTVYPDAYDEDRWNECSNGIHFFLTEEEARAW